MQFALLDPDLRQEVKKDSSLGLWPIEPYFIESLNLIQGLYAKCTLQKSLPCKKFRKGIFVPKANIRLFGEIFVLACSYDNTLSLLLQ